MPLSCFSGLGPDEYEGFGPYPVILSAVLAASEQNISVILACLLGDAGVESTISPFPCLEHWQRDDIGLRGMLKPDCVEMGREIWSSVYVCAWVRHTHTQTLPITVIKALLGQ